MSITNYWFQLIWLLTVGMVLAISLPKKQEIVMGRIEERWQIAPAVLLVVPYILAATDPIILEIPMPTEVSLEKHLVK